MKAYCEICNQAIEPHLQRENKKFCFSCLTEELSTSGAVAAFNIKNKPVQAQCAVCSRETTGHDLAPSSWGFICHDCRDYCSTQSGIPWDQVKISATREWLVKANSRILGPFTTEEMDAALRDNQVVAFDEICRPTGRWHLVREEEQFRLVLNEIRNRQASRRKEQTGSDTLPEEVEGVVQTSSLDAATADIPILHKEALMHGVETKRPTRDVTGTALPEPPLAPRFASQMDPRIKKEINRTSQNKLWLSVLIFVVLSAAATFRLSQKRGQSDERSNSFQDLMAQGLKAEKLGDVAKAFSNFSEARTFKPSDAELLLHLAPLTLSYDRQAIQAQRMFKQILDTEKGANYQKAAQVGMGLVALDAHDLDGAAQAFQAALNIDPDYRPAQANLGVVAYFKDDFVTAEQYFSHLIDSHTGVDGSVLISWADTIIAEASTSSQAREKLHRVNAELESYLQSSKDYRQEVLIELSRVLSLLGKTTDAAHAVDQLLDTDPESPDLHVHDWTYYRGRASWGNLLETLRKVVADLPGTPRMNAAIGLAMYRGHEKVDGAQSIEQALSQAPRDPLLMALAGWVEMKLNRLDTGLVNVKQASLMPDRIKVPHILEARINFNDKDYDGATAQWKLVLSIDPNSLEALNGLAQVAFAKKDAGGVRYWLTQAQAIDSSYIPNLKLAQESQSLAVHENEKGGGDDDP